MYIILTNSRTRGKPEYLELKTKFIKYKTKTKSWKIFLLHLIKAHFLQKFFNAPVFETRTITVTITTNSTTKYNNMRYKIYINIYLYYLFRTQKFFNNANFFPILFICCVLKFNQQQQQQQSKTTRQNTQIFHSTHSSSDQSPV